MITVSIEREVFNTILEALEIGAAWNKTDIRFKKALKALAGQGV